MILDRLGGKRPGMEDTSVSFPGRSGPFLIQPSHPQRLATAMKTSILVTLSPKHAALVSSLFFLNFVRHSLVFSCKTEFLKLNILSVFSASN